VEDSCKFCQEQSGSTQCGGILRKDSICEASHFYITNNEILDLATNYFIMQLTQYYNFMKICMSHSQHTMWGTQVTCGFTEVHYVC